MLSVISTKIKYYRCFSKFSEIILPRSGIMRKFRFTLFECPRTEILYNER